MIQKLFSIWRLYKRLAKNKALLKATTNQISALIQNKKYTEALPVNATLMEAALMHKALLEESPLLQQLDPNEYRAQEDISRVFVIKHFLYLGQILMHYKKLPEAIEQCAQILPSIYGLHDDSLRTTSLLEANMLRGECHLGLGHVVAATGSFNYSLDLLKSLPHPPATLRQACNSSIARALVSMGRYAQAEAYQQEALHLSRTEAECAPFLPVALGNLAVIYQNTERLPEAKACHQEALECRMRSVTPGDDSAGDLATLHKNLGVLYYQTGDTTHAIEQFDLAIACAREVADKPLLLGTMLGNLGGIYMNTANRVPRSEVAARQKQLASAEKLLSESMALFEKNAKDSQQSDEFFSDYQTVLTQQGWLCTHTERIAAAIEAFSQSVEFNQKSLKTAHPEVVSFEASENQSAHLGLIICLLIQHGLDAAALPTFLVSEKLKGRHVAEYLRYEYSSDLFRQRTPDIDDRVIEFDELTAENYAACLPGADACLLSFLRDGSTFYRWLVTPQGVTVNVFELPDGFDSFFTEPSATADAEYTGEFTMDHLAALCLGGMEEKLSPYSHVVVCPDAGLYRVPFEALAWGEGVFGDAFAVSYAPSATVLHQVRTRAKAPRSFEREFVAFANPPISLAHPDLRALLAFEKSLTAIAGRFGTAPVVGKAATIERVLDTIRGARIVHFGCHGYFDSADPEKQYLLLAPQVDEDDATGYLYASDVLSLPLSAELTVCGACLTGRGRIQPGLGISGISTAFLIAGTDCVLVTLWEVNSATVSVLFESLYKRLQQFPEEGVARSLQVVRKEMREAPLGIYSDPYHWAPVVCYGIG